MSNETTWTKDYDDDNGDTPWMVWDEQGEIVGDFYTEALADRVIADHAAASRLAELQGDLSHMEKLEQDTQEELRLAREISDNHWAKVQALQEELAAAQAIAPECQHEVTSRLKNRGEYGSGTLTDWLWCATCGAIKVHDSNQDWSRPANGTRSLPKRLNFLEAENATLTGRAALADEIAAMLHRAAGVRADYLAWLTRYDALAATSPAVEKES